MPEGLVKFLKYVRANLDESMAESEDSYVRQLQRAIESIKKSREMGNRYMLFQEMLKEEYNDGLNDGIEIGEAKGRIEERINSILDFLEELGSIDVELKKKIRAYTDLEILKKVLHMAAKAESMEQFEKALEEM